MPRAARSAGWPGGNAASPKVMLPAFAACPATEVVAVASRDGDKARETARPYGCRAVTGYQALLADPDVDAVYERALAAGLQPSTHPRDAEWGERYFHIFDPDGHEISFAKPLPHR